MKLNLPILGKFYRDESSRWVVLGLADADRCTVPTIILVDEKCNLRTMSYQTFISTMTACDDFAFEKGTFVANTSILGFSVPVFIRSGD